MCKVIDAAMTLVNYSIDKRDETGNDSYYVDFYKLHKLLYYAQGYMLAKEGIQLFEEDIEAHNCGPLIPEVGELAGQFDSITKRFFNNNIFALTPDRINVIKFIVNKIGFYTKEKLVNMSKQGSLYKYYYAMGSGTKIPKDSFKKDEYKSIFLSLEN